MSGAPPTDVQVGDVWRTFPSVPLRRVFAVNFVGWARMVWHPGTVIAGGADVRYLLEYGTLVERPEGTPYPAYTKDGDQ